MVLNASIHMLHHTHYCTLLQGYDAGSKEYIIVLHSSKQEVKHTLEGTLWRQHKAEPAAAGTPGAAGLAQVGGDKESLVGHRIDVWWPMDKAWYGGKVTVSVVGSAFRFGGCHGNVRDCWTSRGGLWQGLETSAESGG
jgi:hypothetical protein